LKRTSEFIYDEVEKTVRFSFEVFCSKGTYIRTLAVDIGKKLGYPARTSELTRIRSDNTLSVETYTLEVVNAVLTNDNLENLLLPIDVRHTQITKITIDDKLWNRVKNGALLDEEDITTEEYPVLFVYKQVIVALYDKHPKKTGKLKPLKMFKIEM